MTTISVTDEWGMNTPCWTIVIMGLTSSHPVKRWIKDLGEGNLIDWVFSYEESDATVYSTEVAEDKRAAISAWCQHNWVSYPVSVELVKVSPV